MHAGSRRPDGSRRRPMQLAGGVPKQLRTDVALMGGLVCLVLVGIGVGTWVLAGVRPEDRARAATAGGHHHRGRDQQHAVHARWSKSGPLDAFGPAMQRTTDDDVPEDVRPEFIGGGPGDDAPNRGGREEKPPTFHGDSATRKSARGDDETPRAPTVDHLQRLMSEATKQPKAVDPLDAQQHALLAPLLRKAPGADALGPAAVCVIVPVRSAAFPHGVVASVIDAATPPVGAPSGGGPPVVDPLPADGAHGNITLIEIIVVGTRALSGAAAELARYARSAVPVRVVQWVAADAVKQVCLASMVNAAEREASPAANAVLVLLPHFDIAAAQHPRLFIASLVAGLRSSWAASGTNRARAANRGHPAMASCTVVETNAMPSMLSLNATTAIASDGLAPAALAAAVASDPEAATVMANAKLAWRGRISKNPFRVVEKGLYLATTTAMPALEHLVPEQIHLVRHLHGYSFKDSRAQELVTDVDAVPLDCALLRRDIFQAWGGLPTAGHTNVDLAGVNRTDMSLDQQTLRCKARSAAVKLFFASVSIQDAASLPATPRKLLAEILQGIMSRDEALEKLAKAYGHTEYPLTPAEDAEIKAFAKAYSQGGLTQGLLERAKKFVDDGWADLAIAQDVAGEQERGYEYSLRANYEGFRVVATNGTAVADAEAAGAYLPPHSVEFGRERYYDFASYLLSKRLTSKWSRPVHVARTKLAVAPELRGNESSFNSTFRVLWDFFCCECCGFANEVQDLLAALQPYVEANSVAAPRCYCPGPPVAVGDVLNRGYVGPERVNLLPADEQLVFIVHRQPSQYKDALEKYFTYTYDKGEPRLPSYVIGRSMYEFDRIHPRWVNATRVDADEVWVPAQWVRDVFVRSGVRESKVFVVPEAIDVSVWDPTLHRRIAWPPETVHKSRLVCNRPPPPTAPKAGPSSRFTFFSDFKLEPRKGWDVLFEAYRRAFDAKDPVSLYVLTNLFLIGVPREVVNSHNTTMLIEVFNAVMAGKFNKRDALDESFANEDWPHFCFIIEAVASEDLVEMYNSADAFVMPTRGEGWGLPIVQAMAMGKPVLATRYGGQSEFLNDGNSYAIDYHLDQLPPDTPYASLDALPDQQWAMPSIEHTARQMQAIVHDRAGRHRRGAQARRDILSNYSYDAVAQVMVAHLQRVRRNIEAGVNLREEPLPPLERPLKRQAEDELERIEAVNQRAVQTFNEQHPGAQLRYRGPLPTDAELYQWCADQVALAHLQVAYRQLGKRLPEATAEQVLPEHERRRRLRIARIMEAMAHHRPIDAVKMELLDFPFDLEKRNHETSAARSPVAAEVNRAINVLGAVLDKSPDQLREAEERRQMELAQRRKDEEEEALARERGKSKITRLDDVVRGHAAGLREGGASPLQDDRTGLGKPLRADLGRDPRGDAIGRHARADGGGRLSDEQRRGSRLGEMALRAMKAKQLRERQKKQHHPNGGDGAPRDPSSFTW